MAVSSVFPGAWSYEELQRLPFDEYEIVIEEVRKIMKKRAKAYGK
jgi:hypothetical protein